MSRQHVLKFSPGCLTQESKRGRKWSLAHFLASPWGKHLLVVRLWCRVPKPVTKTEAGKADRRGEMSAPSNVLGKCWVDGKYQWELMPL